MKNCQAVYSDPVEDPGRLVRRIACGDPEAEEQLYQIFTRGVRYLMIRKLGNPGIVDDEVHTSFIITMQAIRDGVLREPDRLMGFIRTIVMRRIAENIERAIFCRNRTIDALHCEVPDRRLPADQKLIQTERREIAAQALREISPGDREVLVRFYLYEQSPEQICRAMRLTQTQFRLLKSRAKARFAQRGRRKLLVRRFVAHVALHSQPNAVR